MVHGAIPIRQSMPRMEREEISASKRGASCSLPIQIRQFGSPSWSQLRLSSLPPLGSPEGSEFAIGEPLQSCCMYLSQNACSVLMDDLLPIDFLVREGNGIQCNGGSRHGEAFPWRRTKDPLRGLPVLAETGLVRFLTMGSSSILFVQQCQTISVDGELAEHPSTLHCEPGSRGSWASIASPALCETRHPIGGT